MGQPATHTDANGNLSLRTTRAGQVISTAYDALNRPTHVSWDPAPSQSTPTAGSVAFTHTYSAANQRTHQGVSDSTWLTYPGAAGSTTYTANALDQYASVDAFTPVYDANGNLTCDGWVTYAYDAESRLTGIRGRA